MIRLSSRGIEAAGSHQNRTCGCGLDIRPSYPGNPTVWPQSCRMEETIKVFQNKTIQCDLHENGNLPDGRTSQQQQEEDFKRMKNFGVMICSFQSSMWENRTRTLLITHRCEVEVFMCNMKTVQNCKSNTSCVHWASLRASSWSSGDSLWLLTNWNCKNTKLKELN